MNGRRELQHIYEDWMGEDIPQSNATYEMMDCLDAKYSDCIDTSSFRLIDDSTSDDEREYYHLRSKVTACHQKLNMMQYARKKAIECRCEFETTQNMCCPALFGVEKTQILFYAETTVLLARSALDIAAPFFSKLLFGNRTDSFNDLSKKIINETSGKHSALHQYFKTVSNNPSHAFRLLCGVTKGRALRDIIVHQSNIRIHYLEYRENSEKEKLFVIVNDTYPIEFDEFLFNLCSGVEEILQVMVSETAKYETR